MFARLKEKLAGAASRMSGRTDLLEATCAACALTAAADGDIADSEVGAIMDALTNHPTLSVAFKASQIEQCADGMLKRAKGGLMGRRGLQKEIEQAVGKSTADDLELILCVAIDVSRSDGQGVGAEEQKVLGNIATTLRLDLRSYLNA